MSVLLAAFGFGIVSAAVLSVATLGFTMQFAMTNVLNLAYGDVMIFTAYIAYYLNIHGVSLWVALAPAAVVAAVVSVLINRYVYIPFQRRGASHTSLIIVTLATGIIITNGVLAVAGSNGDSYRISDSSGLSLGSFQLTMVQLGIIALSVALIVAVQLLVSFTRLGRMMRATAANPELARSSGVRTGLVVGVAWLISGALCGLGGIIFAMNSGTFGPQGAAGFLIFVLAAAFLGGIGRPSGALVGALLIGLVTELSAALIPSGYKYVIALVILFVVMLVRPEGLLARTRNA